MPPKRRGNPTKSSQDAVKPEGDGGAPVVGGTEEGSQTSTSTSGSSTLVQDTLVPVKDDLTAEERRKLKGKSKQTDEDQLMDQFMDEGGAVTKEEDNELTRMKKELAFKDSLIRTQQALLSSVQSSLSCPICLEIMEEPYVLTCGHACCRKCLVAWWQQKKGDDANADLPLSLSSGSSHSHTDSDSQSDASDDSDSSDILLPPPPTGHHAVSGVIDGSEYTGSVSHELWEDMWDDPAKYARAYNTAREGPSGSGGRRAIEPASTSGSAPRNDEGETDLEKARRARLERFGGGGSAASASRTERSRRVSSAELLEVEPLPPPPAPPTLHPPHPHPPHPRARSQPHSSSDSSDGDDDDPPFVVPTGLARLQAITCPECRVPLGLEDRPIRYYAFEGVIETIRAHAEGGEKKKKGKKEKKENDGLFGGLFANKKVAGVKDKKREGVFSDVSDGVRRCNSCGWEVQRHDEECDHCGAAIINGVFSDDDEDLHLHSDHSQFSDSSASDDDANSEDIEFIDDNVLLHILSSGSDSESESEAEVTPARRKRRIEEVVVSESGSGSEDSESDSESDSDVEVRPQAKKRRVVRIESSEEEDEEGNSDDVLVRDATDSDSDSDSSSSSEGDGQEMGRSSDDEDGSGAPSSSEPNEAPVRRGRRKKVIPISDSESNSD